MSFDRSAGAAAALVVAAAHVPITAEHLHEAPYIGVSFIALEAACVVLACLLLLQPKTRWVWPAAGLLAGAAISAYLLSRTLGLPEIGDDVGNWSDPLGVLALSAEAVLATLAYFARRPRHANMDVADLRHRASRDELAPRALS